jgi:hypothetical protein
MSYCISRLHLELPPASLRRVGTHHAPYWVASCERYSCDWQSKGREAVSLVMDDWLGHAEIHRVVLGEELAEERRKELERGRRRLRRVPLSDRIPAQRAAVPLREQERAG